MGRRQWSTSGQTDRQKKKNNNKSQCYCPISAISKHIIVERMHKSSSLVLILSIFLIHYQNVKCGSKSDDQWWNHLGLETNQKSQWTTIDNKDIPDNTAQSSNRSVKRSSAAFNDNNTDSPVRTRSRNWEKSFARKRDFDRTWSDGQPIRERFRETEWDDDVPVRHVFKDSTSAVDEGNTRIRMGDDVKIERMSRVWTGDDGDDDDDRGTSFVRSSNSGRNSNNSNNRSNTNANNKPKAVTNTYGSTATQQQSPKSDRTDRVLSLNFQDPDSKKKDRERLDRLAKQIFNMDDDNTGTTVRSNGFTGTTAKSNGFTGTTVRNNGFTTTPARSNGNSGNGYVSNAVNSFTRGSGNTYVSNNANNGYMRNSGNEFTNNKNNDKTNTNKLGADSVKPTKPKMIVMFETTPKPVPSNTAKSTANDVRNVAEKPKSTTTPIAPSAQLKSQFGWRSSISHNKDQKLQTQNQKLQESNEETDNFEDIEEDIDDTTTARPTRVPVTRPPVVIRTTVRPTTTRATFRPTIRPTVEYTTYRMTDTTRPQTTTSITNKPNNRETTVLTTTRPKLSQPNAVTNSLAPNKKQHRMGSWVDSDSMDYELGDNAADCGTNCPIGDNEAISDWAEEPIDDRSQPIVESEEFGNEQLPERVEDAAVPEVESPKFARQRQSAPAGGEREDQSGWTLEDALPGVPGTDYPTFATIPKTAFDCKTHQWPGYYADVETQCQSP
ncbi:unnamed protein product [Medioppia subpectinata]|uniref:Uncharacterized protein n=1 Tax=Medioppia subpectinata TaxID=1979941 RepID=A0A7R9KGJ9_9ACAR|nr:unnamed protein product [Medioppia subpectinata]CAG2102958.1 unnamed protein product [Medioppia subpectinata]